MSLTLVGVGHDVMASTLMGSILMPSGPINNPRNSISFAELYTPPHIPGGVPYGDVIYHSAVLYTPPPSPSGLCSDTGLS